MIQWSSQQDDAPVHTTKASQSHRQEEEAYRDVVGTLLLSKLLKTSPLHTVH